MSALLNASPKDANGVIALNGQLAATLTFVNGLPYEGESLAVDSIGAIAYYHQGLPFTAVHRLAVNGNSPGYYNSGAAPFTNLGKLCLFSDTATDYSSGVPYVALGQVQSLVV
jgi:hypothetical protein